MMSKSTLHDRGSFNRRALWRALWVMLMAFLAYAVLSGSPVAAQTVSPAAADAAGAPAGPSSDTSDTGITTVWVEVYESATRLADAGSAAASRLALQMHRYGPSVYGVSFEASDMQLRRWQWQAECAGLQTCDDAG